MKLPRKRWIVLFSFAALVGGLVFGIFFGPSLGQSRYKSKWIERFSAYRGGGEIPTEWEEEVARRSLPTGEWILAAMHHGTCSPGPEGRFDASVILDSSGAIYYRDWSPCAGRVSSGVKFWENELEPVINLADLHGNRTKWRRVEPGSPR